MRKYYIDYLRVVLMIGVIILHVSANNWYGYVETNRWIVFTIYSAICRVAVPCFFMISGALFLDDSKKLEYMKFAKNHIIKMIIVLFVWSMFYQVYALDGNINVFTIRVAIKNVLLGETQTHLWFLYVTIGFYLLVPIIKVYTNSASKNSMVYTLLIIGMITIGIDTLSMLTGTIPVIVSNNISKMTLSSGKYVFYFLVGHYIDKYNLPKRPCRILNIVGVIALGLEIYITVTLSRVNMIPNENWMRYTSIFVAANAVAVYACFRNLEVTEPSRLIKNMANCSMGIYLVHMFWILELWKHNFTTFSFNAVISVPVISIIVLTLSWITVFVLKRIPVIRKFV